MPEPSPYLTEKGAPTANPSRISLSMHYAEPTPCLRLRISPNSPSNTLALGFLSDKQINDTEKNNTRKIVLGCALVPDANADHKTQSDPSTEQIPVGQLSRGMSQCHGILC